jgi:hypothetical protein
LWLFAGKLASASIANALDSSGIVVSGWDDVSVTARVSNSEVLAEVLDKIQPITAVPALPEEMETSLKFGLCLPGPVARAVLVARASAPVALAHVLSRKRWFVVQPLSAV